MNLGRSALFGLMPKMIHAFLQLAPGNLIAGGLLLFVRFGPNDACHTRHKEREVEAAANHFSYSKDRKLPITHAGDLSAREFDSVLLGWLAGPP